MNTIFQTLVYQREKGLDAVLATIIWDDGSAPRGRGSQMLVGRVLEMKCDSYREVKGYRSYPRKLRAWPPC